MANPRWFYPFLIWSLIQHSLWPDPFRFYPPRQRWWVTLYSPVLNFLILWSHGVFGLRISGHQTLKRFLDQHHTPRLILSNHVGFTDPHLVMAWEYFHQPHQTRWLAGIEPFESIIPRYTLTGNGAFSVDRGSLDRASLKVAQQTVAEGRYPLVVFMEGEALYRHQQLGPCKPGAAQLLLKSTTNTASSACQFLPINMQYRLWHRHPKHYARHYQQTIKQLLAHTPLTPLPVWDNRLPLPQQAKALAALGIRLVWQQHQPDITPPATPQEQASLLISQLVQHLAGRHGVSVAVPDMADLDAVMDAKNKLRSAVVKRLRPPKTAWLQHYQRWLANLADTTANRWLLPQAERVMFGQSSDKPTEARVQQLQNHISRLISLAETRDAQSSETRAQWRRDLDTCRQIKLLAVVADDLNHPLSLPKDWDAIRYKVELLVAHKARHRGPKTAFLSIGQPHTVPPNATATELHATMVSAISALIQR